jgi:hypothetical protein
VFPQPLASQEVLEGQQFFRLYTPLQSGGDAYELDVGALAFALGPQSDLSAVRLTYYDPGQPNQVNSAVIGIDTPFIGRIDALASLNYPVANTRARIIATPEDLWNNNWVPTLLAEDLNYIRPRLDLISYLTPPVGPPPMKRADFVERGRVQIDVANSSYLIAVPFYRREYAELRIRNRTAAPIATMTVDVIGVHFSTDGISPAYSSAVVAENPIVTASPVAAAADSVSTFRILGSSFGLFDYLLFRINLGAAGGLDAATPNAVRYWLRTSDEQPGT